MCVYISLLYRFIIELEYGSSSSKSFLGHRNLADIYPVCRCSSSSTCICPVCCCFFCNWFKWPGIGSWRLVICECNRCIITWILCVASLFFFSSSNFFNNFQVISSWLNYIDVTLMQFKFKSGLVKESVQEIFFY